MTQCEVGHEVNLIDNTVRMTFHKVIEKTMVHFSMSPEEARDMAERLWLNADKVKIAVKNKVAEGPKDTLTFED